MKAGQIRVVLPHAARNIDIVAVSLPSKQVYAGSIPVCCSILVCRNWYTEQS
jgi:hypothetical protein